MLYFVCACMHTCEVGTSRVCMDTELNETDRADFPEDRREVGKIHFEDVLNVQTTVAIKVCCLA